MIDRRTFLGTLAGSFLAWPHVVEAQPAKIPTIGLFAGGPGEAPPRAFIEGLQELGYVKDRNVRIEDRFANSYKDLVRAATELVRLKADVIVAFGSPAAQVARDSIVTVPVVFVTFADPVQTGLVASLARPGRNLTGLTMITSKLIGKRLELLKEALPGVSRLAVLLNPVNPSSREQLAETQAAARALGVRVEAHEARAPEELEGSFAAMKQHRADALFTLADSMFFFERSRITTLAAKSRLPAMFHERRYVDSDGLMSYGPSFADLNRRAATFVDKILRGAKPADLPVEQPTKFELVINLKTAKALGLTIPPSLLARADQVIE